MMFKATDSRHAPWYVIRSDDKKRAPQLHTHVRRSLQAPVARQGQIAKTLGKGRYNDQASLRGMKFVAEHTRELTGPGQITVPGGGHYCMVMVTPAGWPIIQSRPLRRSVEGSRRWRSAAGRRRPPPCSARANRAVGAGNVAGACMFSA